MEIILEWSTFMVDGHHIYLSLLESVNWGWVNYNKAFREYIHIAIDVVWCFFFQEHTELRALTLQGSPIPKLWCAKSLFRPRPRPSGKHPCTILEVFEGQGINMYKPPTSRAVSSFSVCLENRVCPCQNGHQMIHLLVLLVITNNEFSTYFLVPNAYVSHMFFLCMHDCVHDDCIVYMHGWLCSSSQLCFQTIKEGVYTSLYN